MLDIKEKIFLDFYSSEFKLVYGNQYETKELSVFCTYKGESLVLDAGSVFALLNVQLPDGQSTVYGSVDGTDDICRLAQSGNRIDLRLGGGILSVAGTYKISILLTSKSSSKILYSSDFHVIVFPSSNIEIDSPQANTLQSILNSYKNVYSQFVSAVEIVKAMAKSKYAKVHEPVVKAVSEANFSINVNQVPSFIILDGQSGFNQACIYGTNGMEILVGFQNCGSSFSIGATSDCNEVTLETNKVYRLIYWNGWKKVN